MSIYDNPPAEGTGTGFVKIKDGESVRLRLVTETIEFAKAFREGENPSRRYGAIVIEKIPQPDGKPLFKEVKAYEFGASVFGQLCALYAHPEFGDPTGYDVTVSRKGAGQLDTKYHLVASPPKALSEDEKKLVAEFGKTPADVFLASAKSSSATDSSYDPFASED